MDIFLLIFIGTGLGLAIILWVKHLRAQEANRQYWREKAGRIRNTPLPTFPNSPRFREYKTRPGSGFAPTKSDGSPPAGNTYRSNGKDTVDISPTAIYVPIYEDSVFWPERRKATEVETLVPHEPHPTAVRYGGETSPSAIEGSGFKTGGGFGDEPAGFTTGRTTSVARAASRAAVDPTTARLPPATEVT